MKTHPRATRLVLFSGSILLSLAAAEIALRIMGYPRLPVSGWKPAPTYECNQLGFRGRTILPDDGSYRVLLVGDSQVESWAYPHTHMPERVLEAQLASSMDRRVRVFTVGASGYGQDQQYLAMQEYFADHDADLVLLWYTVGNDLENTTFPVTASGTPKPMYWLEEGLLRGPSERWLRPIDPGLRLLALGRGYSPLKRLRDWTSRMPEPYRPVVQFEGRVLPQWQAEWDAGKTFRFIDMSEEVTTKALFLTPRSPRMKYNLDLSRALLDSMRGLARKHGADFHIFLELRSPINRDQTIIGQRLNGAIYLTSKDQYWQNMDYLFDGFSLHMIPIEFPDMTVSQQDAHLNQRAIEHVLGKMALELAGPSPPGSR